MKKCAIAPKLAFSAAQSSGLLRTSMLFMTGMTLHSLGGAVTSGCSELAVPQRCLLLGAKCLLALLIAHSELHAGQVQSWSVGLRLYPPYSSDSFFTVTKGLTQPGDIYPA